MVNALVYHIASGQAFFSGVVLIHVAWLVGVRQGGRWPARARNALALAGLLLIAVSATPLPMGFYLVAGMASLAWLAAEGIEAGAAQRVRPWPRLAVLAVWWVGMAMELPYHQMPQVPRMGDPVVVVVGDSLAPVWAGSARPGPGCSPTCAASGCKTSRWRGPTWPRR